MNEMKPEVKAYFDTLPKNAAYFSVTENEELKRIVCDILIN